MQRPARTASSLDGSDAIRDRYPPPSRAAPTVRTLHSFSLVSRVNMQLFDTNQVLRHGRAHSLGIGAHSIRRTLVDGECRKRFAKRDTARC